MAESIRLGHQLFQHHIMLGLGAVALHNDGLVFSPREDLDDKVMIARLKREESPDQ